MNYLYFENENGDRFQTAYLNGYYIGDRLLEDVMFECKIQDGELNVLGVETDSVPYFSGLNEELWLKRAQEYSQDFDLFADEHGNDCWFVTEEDLVAQNTPA